MKQTSKKRAPRSSALSPRKSERKYQLRSEIAYRVIEGQVLVLAPRQESLFTLNASGQLLWAALKRGATQKRLAALLTAEYDLPLAEAQRDVEVFLRELNAKGILVRK